MIEALATADSAVAVPLEALIEQGREAERTGDWNLALECYESALARVGKEGTAADAARVIRWIGTVHRERGDMELAAELYDTSLTIAELHGLTDQVASSLNCIGIIEQFAGRPNEADRLYREARAKAHEAGDQQTVGIVEQNLGALATMRGDIPSALLNYTSALFRYRLVGDRRSATGALNNMGMAHVDLNDLDAAEACFTQAYELANGARDMLTLGYVQLNRAEIFMRRQQFEHARQCCDDAFGVFTSLESRQGLGESYKFYGALYRETGKAHLADIHLNLALKLAQSASNVLLQAEIQHELARVHLDERRSLDAISCLNRAHRLFHEVQARRDVLDIENTLEELDSSYVRVVQRWGTEAIESKDPYTLGHSERVAEYTNRLASAVGVEGRELTWLKIGAFLHDVGKTVVPSDVLVKPGVLNQSEWDLMKRHTVVGDEIVSGLELPYDVSGIVRSHHERWDGLGYPDGIAGTDIPLHARILSVADVYDALTTARSYRNPFSPDEARRVLTRQSGRALDPQLVEAFEDAVLCSN